MLKKILVLVLAISLLGVLVACQQNNDVDGPETDEIESKIDEIKSKGKIVLGTTADYPPFEFHKIIDGEDQIVGFDIEIGKLIAEELEVELEIVDMKFDGLLAALVTDDIDMVIAGMVADETRAKTVDFSIPYYQGQHRMVVRIEDKDIYKGPEDLVGKIVGAQKATTQEEEALDKFSESDYVGLSKITDLVLELQNNKVDAIILVDPVAKAYVDQNDNLFMAEMIIAQEDGISVAVNKGNEDFLEVIDGLLESLIEDGTLERLMTEATELVEE